METDNYGIILELMVFGDCLSFIKDYTGSILAGSLYTAQQKFSMDKLKFIFI